MLWYFYVVAVLGLAAGIIAWKKSKEINFWEGLIAGGVGLLLAIIINVVVCYSMHSDIETWSGRITTATYHPTWVEEYQQRHSRTTGSGKNRTTVTWYTTEHRTHNKYWSCSTDLESSPRRISEDKFKEILNNFGGELQKEKPWKSGFDSGDPYVYHATNSKGVIIPVTTTEGWRNPVIAAPSKFKFNPVPEAARNFLPQYPTNGPWQSGRLVYHAKKAVRILAWDQMNTRLGPMKKVNVLLVGFDCAPDQSSGQFLASKWKGGKKNDLVLCYGGMKSGGFQPTWGFVFGWTERDDVKKNLQAILVANEISDDIIPLIETEIKKNYTIFDWSKFENVKVEPPFWVYFLFTLLIGLGVAATITIAQKNQWPDPSN